MGRPVHERDRPAVGLDGRSVGPPARGRRDREPPERAGPPGAARRPPADPSTGQRRPARGPDGRGPDGLLADWADRCRAAGGLVVAAHFPLPYAEIAADIVTGKIDAIETQALAPGLDDPAVLEWYRFLDLGYRLPIVAGTDKMSAEVPVGAVRTYAHLATDDPLTFDAWAAAVRAGRTFVTSGPILELTVEGTSRATSIRLRSAGQPGGRGPRAGRPGRDRRPRARGQRPGRRDRDRGRRFDRARPSTRRSTIGAGTWIAARSRSEERDPVGLHDARWRRTRRRSTSRSRIARSCRRPAMSTSSSRSSPVPGPGSPSWPRSATAGRAGPDGRLLRRAASRRSGSTSADPGRA